MPRDLPIGRVNRLGVWTDERFSWLSDAGWGRELRYGRDSLVTECALEHREMEIKLDLKDAVVLGAKRAAQAKRGR